MGGVQEERVGTPPIAGMQSRSVSDQREPGDRSPAPEAVPDHRRHGTDLLM